MGSGCQQVIRKMSGNTRLIVRIPHIFDVLPFNIQRDTVKFEGEAMGIDMKFMDREKSAIQNFIRNQMIPHYESMDNRRNVFITKDGREV